MVKLVLENFPGSIINEVHLQKPEIKEAITDELINNEEEWAKASFLASQAAHYSTVYDVWCKDMINKRVKMGMAKKMKGKKKKEG